MDFRVLGPLEVWDGERPLSLGGGRQRALLAMLLLHANRVVSVETLTAALWGEAAPGRAEAALLTHVAALRRLLEPERDRRAPGLLTARDDGYLLQVGAGMLDLDQFEQLAGEGRRLLDGDPAAAAERLRAALALWRGDALGDVALEGEARTLAARLDERRLSVVEDRIAAELELGRHAAVVAELGALVAAHPRRERLLGELMLALHRCGCTAEALTAFRDARGVLDPGPELQSLERAIRGRDPGVAAPPRRTGAPAPPPGPIPAEAGEPAGSSPAPRWRRRVLLGAVAVVVVLAVALGGLLLHPWSSSSSPALGPGGPQPQRGPFPDAAERTLMARFPAFAAGCHRYGTHYARAIAEVECGVTPDHPGATSIVYQGFANYRDLEEHFHHVLALTIQSETGRPLSAAHSGACSDPGSGFFAASDYPTAGEVQDAITSPTAHGHLFCYVDHAGVPRIAWTNVDRLVVAQAAGHGTGATAGNGLLDLWEFAGPAG